MPRPVLCVLVLVCACNELGVTVDISARPDVPPLESLEVEVSQGPLHVTQHFSLARKPLPQSVAIVSKGMTRGTVSIFVQGIGAGTVQAQGSAMGTLEPAASAPHVDVILERVCAECGVLDGGTDGGSELDAGCTPQLKASDMCSIAEVQCGAIRADDGCGMNDFDCGGCATGEQCVGGSCCSPPASAVQMCSSNGFMCGYVRMFDSCGQLHALDCGGCSQTEACTMSDVGSACGPCVSENDATFCARQGATCGVLAAADNCGAARTVDCGGCDAGVACGSNGVANQCECLPLLSGCVADNQCCTRTCEDAGFCCVPLGGTCIDDADCCGQMDCSQSVCSPYADGGFSGNGLSDDGGVL